MFFKNFLRGEGAKLHKKRCKKISRGRFDLQFKNWRGIVAQKLSVWELFKVGQFLCFPFIKVENLPTEIVDLGMKMQNYEKTNTCKLK